MTQCLNCYHPTPDFLLPSNLLLLCRSLVLPLLSHVRDARPSDVRVDGRAHLASCIGLAREVAHNMRLLLDARPVREVQ